MGVSHSFIKTMLLGISEFFRFIAFNEEKRLYYVVPVKPLEPYAYQHSSIRDVATVVDILDLVVLFERQKIPLRIESKELFKDVAANTLKAYHNLYDRAGLPRIPDGNIGDIGFFLLLLKTVGTIFPDILPYRWQLTRDHLIEELLVRSRIDGSIEVFFDPGLKGFEKQSEAFYLPEALIGLISLREVNPVAIDDVVKKAVTYSIQGRASNLASDSAIFYANWQFQLLYYWLAYAQDKAAVWHLEKLVEGVKALRFTSGAFGPGTATVEVACYVEGLVHAKRTLEALGKVYDAKWFDKEISRSFLFLNDVQVHHMRTIHGGFTHSLNGSEARLDVAGHVFSALRRYL